MTESAEQGKEPLGRLGGVVLYRKIYEGDVFTVFAGHSDKLGRDVAVKVFCRRCAEPGDGFPEKIKRDTTFASRLFHPNIARVFYQGNEGEYSYLVMELLNEESLAGKVRREGPLPAETVAEIGRSVAGALDYAYATYGIVHRGVKPAHLLFDQDGRVKIADMGFSEIFDGDLVAEGSSRQPSQDASPGTFGFMSPEQASGDSDVDLRSDIYSLGATLFYALSGKEPLGDDLNGRLTLGEVAPGAPEWLVGVIDKMMQPDPAERFQDYHSVLLALKPPGRSSIRGFKRFEKPSSARKPSAGDIPEAPAIPEIPAPSIPVEQGALYGGRTTVPVTKRAAPIEGTSATGWQRPVFYSREALIVMGAVLFIAGFACGVIIWALFG